METLVFSFLREGAVCVLGVENQPGQALSCAEAQPRSEPSIPPTGNTTRPVVLCKTLIQLDGDIVSWVSPSVLANPDLLDQHHDAVLRELQSASGVAQSWLRKVTRAGVALRWGGGTLIVGGNATLWHTLTSAVLPLIISVATAAAWHYGTRFAVKRLARRALQNLRALA